MAIIFGLTILVVLFVRWVIMRDRLQAMESSIADLRRRLDAFERAQTRREPEPAPAPPVIEPPREEPPIVEPPPAPAPPQERVSPPPFPIARPRRQPAAAREWETVLGGNWLNKLGVFVLIVGLALLLRYSFTQFGPGGRVAICLAASLSLLVAGAMVEPRERYRIFARGLLGGGWAGLYVTVYAMHAVEAARVIDSPVLGAILLIAVATGMIIHSLRYRSQTITALAYFVAFGTLAITDMTTLPHLALVPLAASLLYVTHRFKWTRMALFALVATYAVVVIRGDSGAPLWQAQTIFAIYWLIFEVFDVLHPEAWLLPFNAVGFLGLSLLKWQSTAPDLMWMLLAATAGAYLVSAVARVRSGKWQGAATLTAALLAAAIFQKLDHQWIASALLVEAELFYLAGIRLRAPYLRWLAISLFGIEAVRLASDVVWLPAAQWVPVASLDAVVFYMNRALYAADVFFGYAGAAAVALVIGKEAHEPYRSILWMAAASAAFAFGWWRKLFDFRLQGYLLLVLGLAGIASETRELPLAVAAGLCYAAVLCALRSGADRFQADEQRGVRFLGAFASVAALMALVWQLTPGEYLGIAWIALAAAILELGMRGLPSDFRRMAYAAAAIGAVRAWIFNVPGLHNTGAWDLRLMPLWAALLLYAFAWRARREENGMVSMAASSTAWAFATTAMWALLPADAVAPAWALFTVALMLAARQWKLGVFAGQSLAAAALAYLWAMFHLPGALAAWPAAVVIACFYAAQLLAPRGARARLYFSLLATTLSTALLYYRISGSMLTMACGIQGVILLASGFPLRDRVLRISGLVLLLACILKLFLWDLRHLETLPRIFSFIGLGVILLAVSWIYTRFRERVAKFL